MKPSLKVFIMSVIGFVVTTVSMLEAFSFPYVAIVTMVFAVSYWLKNYFMPSDSGEGVANWKDILSGIIIAVNMALSNLAATLLTGTEFSMQVLWVTIAGAVIGYFTKTVPQGAKTAEIARSRSFRGIRKAAMIILLVGITGIASAQGPFNGFFKSTDQNVKSYSFRTEVPVESVQNLWLMRPYWNITAQAYNIKDKTTGSFMAQGMGLSYGNYSTVNNKAWCNLSVNASLLTQVQIGDVVDMQFGGALSVGLFDNLLSIGAGYVNKQALLLLGVGYTF